MHISRLNDDDDDDDGNDDNNNNGLWWWWCGCRGDGDGAANSVGGVGACLVTLTKYCPQRNDLDPEPVKTNFQLDFIF